MRDRAISGAQSIQRYGVFRQITVVHRRVHVSDSGRGPQDLTDDLQLTGIDFSRQQTCLDVVQTVHRKQLQGRVQCIAYADTHVQPGITVQVIVAQIALEGVAAAAADDDFGPFRDVDDRGVERHGVHLRGGQAQKFSEAVDQTDVLRLQIAFVRRVARANAGSDDRGPGQYVVVFPA